MSTTTPTTPRTLLDAVNQLLRAIRVSNVMSLLTTDLNDDAAAAKQALDSAAVEFQTEGWEFNTERKVTLDPSPEGFIYLPSNTLRARTARNSSGDWLVQRGDRLYNPASDKRTFNIGESVEVDIVLALVFEELPAPARLYVTGLAARRFCPPKLPTGATFAYTEEWLQGARTAVEQYDTDMQEYPLPVTSPHFWKMARR